MTQLEQLREACAKVCDEEAARYRDQKYYGLTSQVANAAASTCAAAIRAIDLTQFEQGDKEEEK